MTFPESIGNFKLGRTYKGTLPEAAADAVGSCDSYGRRAAEWYASGKTAVIASYDFFGMKDYSIQMIIRSTEAAAGFSYDDEDEQKDENTEFFDGAGYSFDIDLVLISRGLEEETLDSFEDWNSFWILDSTPESQKIEETFLEFVKTVNETEEFFLLVPEKWIPELVGQYW